MQINNNKPLQIAILVRKFPNIVQTYVLNHILSLKKAGHKTIIIAENDPKQSEVHPHIHNYKLLDETLYVDATTSGFLKGFFTTPLTKYSYLSAVIKIITSGIWKKYGIKYGLKSLIRARALSKDGFDIVHSHSLAGSYAYLFLKDYFSIPITTTFHGLVPKNVKMLDIDKIEAALNTSDAFFVNTKFARKQLTDFGCEKNKIHIIPQGTNIADFPFKARKILNDCPIIILSVGRLSIEKGFHIAIKAITNLIEQYPTIKYHIIGGGPEEQNLKQLIQDLKLQDTVKIVGSVTTEILLSEYSSAHIFILPSIDFRDGSHTETQGVVLQEAQCSGIPVIASRTGGIPEIIKDGTTGLLFEEENVEQLSGLIKSLVSDDKLYHALHVQGRKDVVDNYSIEVICEQLLSVYKNILSNKTGS